MGFRFRSMRSALRVCGAAAAVALPAVLSAPPARAEVPFAQMAVEAETGRVLHAVNPDGLIHPASLVKIMTLYMVFEAIDAGRVSPHERIAVSPHAAGQSPSKLAIPAGKTIAVRDAILAVVTKSANDMAVALAERVSGNESTFARAMTGRAQALGMVNTVFRNASGLPHPQQVTTARDMTTLARALIRDYPHHYVVFATPDFTYGGVTHRNHNQLLDDYQGADGIKTGFIRASGYNLVASAVRDKRRVVGVVMGDRSPATRNSRMAELLDRGFEAAVGTRIAAFPTPPDRLRTSVAGMTKPAKQPIKVAQAKPAVPPRIKAPVQMASAESGQWAIQVGAFHRYALAEQAAQNAAKLAPGTLVNGEIKIVPSQPRKGKPIYRARIAGLSKTEATKACATLQAKNVTCIRAPAGAAAQVADSS